MSGKFKQVSWTNWLSFSRNLTYKPSLYIKTMLSFRTALKMIKAVFRCDIVRGQQTA